MPPLPQQGRILRKRVRRPLRITSGRELVVKQHTVGGPENDGELQLVGGREIEGQRQLAGNEEQRFSLWSELLPELRLLIATKLPSVVDIARLGVVCRYWEDAISHKKQSLLCPKSPCLLLVSNNKASFDLLSRTNLLPFHLPRIQGRACFGTPFGWLITVGLNRRVHLVNTVTGVRHQLPQVLLYNPELLASNSIHRAVTSLTTQSSTLPEDCVVMVIFSVDKELGFSNRGDTTWKTLENSRGAYDDILYLKGQFYAVNRLGEVKICDINSLYPAVKEFAAPPPPFTLNEFNCLFLVEMDGELHMVVRSQTIDNVHNFGVDTANFDIYRLDLQTKKWTEVTSINKHALFVGGKSCFSVLASEHPDCKENSIYFTFHRRRSNGSCSGYSIGVFDVMFRDSKRVNIYLRDRDIPTCGPPLWIIPKLC